MAGRARKPAGVLLRRLETPAAGAVLADRIMTAIALGEFTPGQRLPAERELAARLGVSRTTVRDALARVVAAGLLEVRRGRSGGAFVLHPWTVESARAVRATAEGTRSRVTSTGPEPALAVAAINGESNEKSPRRMLKSRGGPGACTTKCSIQRRASR